MIPSSYRQVQSLTIHFKFLPGFACATEAKAKPVKNIPVAASNRKKFNFINKSQLSKVTSSQPMELYKGERPRSADKLQMKIFLRYKEHDARREP